MPVWNRLRPRLETTSEVVRQLLDYAIAKEEGGVYMCLTTEQYTRLRQP
jgi:hypothetical protein